METQILIQNLLLILLGFIVILVISNLIYNHQKNRLIKRKSEIDMEAEIIKNLGMLVKSDSSNDKLGREYVYKQPKDREYSFRCQNSKQINGNKKTEETSGS